MSELHSLAKLLVCSWDPGDHGTARISRPLTVIWDCCAAAHAG